MEENFMKCEVHPDKEAVNFCDACGSAVCDDCSVNVGGTSYCRKCFSKQRKTYSSNHQLESFINEFASLITNKIFLLAVIVVIVMILIIIIAFSMNPLYDQVYVDNYWTPPMFE